MAGAPSFVSAEARRPVSSCERRVPVPVVRRLGRAGRSVAASGAPPARAAVAAVALVGVLRRALALLRATPRRRRQPPGRLPARSPGRIQLLPAVRQRSATSGRAAQSCVEVTLHAASRERFARDGRADGQPGRLGRRGRRRAMYAAVHRRGLPGARAPALAPRRRADVGGRRVDAAVQPPCLRGFRRDTPVSLPPPTSSSSAPGRRGRRPRRGRRGPGWTWCSSTRRCSRATRPAGTA